MKGPRYITTEDNILSLDLFLFSCSKDKNGVFVVVYEKPERGYKDFGCEQSRHISSRR